MRTLGIDTSNYATSLAVVSSGKEVFCAEKQFLPVKPGELGLRQSDAVFHHTAALPGLAERMRRQGALRDIGAVGVSSRPRSAQGSYMPCFLAGLSFATAFSAALNVPLVKCSHQEGHIAAALFGAGKNICTQRSIVFHLSGGTTDMLLCRGYRVEQRLGGSLDLFAGQAVDRLGVKLGMAFPAGAALSALAGECSRSIRPAVSVKGTSCHFSGLENQCARLLAEGKTGAYVAKFCLLSIAESLYRMVLPALEEQGGLPVIFAGGVASSEVIRRYLLQRLPTAHFVSPELSADNGAGAALIAAWAGKEEAENGD